MTQLLVEVLPFEVAGPEVRTLVVWDLHVLPGDFALVFQDAQERTWEWTTSRCYKDHHPEASTPKQYTQNALDKAETIAAFEQRTGWRLVAVKWVTPKGG